MLILKRWYTHAFDFHTLYIVQLYSFSIMIRIISTVDESEDEDIGNMEDLTSTKVPSTTGSNSYMWNQLFSFPTSSIFF